MVSNCSIKGVGHRAGPLAADLEVPKVSVVGVDIRAYRRIKNGTKSSAQISQSFHGFAFPRPRKHAQSLAATTILQDGKISRWPTEWLSED